MEIQLNQPGQYKESSIKEHFHFIGKKITEKEIDSFLPFFNCDEIGHDDLQLDQVCLDQNCSRKGLTCPRCIHLRHSNHPTKIVSLRSFISDLIQSQTDKKSILKNEVENCTRYRNLLISMAKEFIDSLIDHFSVFVASVHKYYNIFENEFEDSMIKSDVVIHKLMHKQHVRRDHFAKYIANTVAQLGDGGTFSSNNKKELVLRDYEKAFRISNEFQVDMKDISKQVKLHLTQQQQIVQDAIDLHKLSPKVPEFDVATLAVQSKFKKDFRQKLEDIFSIDTNIPGISQANRVQTTQNSNSLYLKPPQQDFKPGDVFQIKFGGGKKDFVNQIEYLKPTLLETQVRKRPANLIIYDDNSNYRQNSKQINGIGSKDAVDLYMAEKSKIGSSISTSSMPNIFGLNLQGSSSQGPFSQGSLQIYAPRLGDYVQGGEFLQCSVDSGRKRCLLGRIFKTVTNGNIIKISTIKSSIKDLSCLCVISEDIIAIGGRFNQEIEFYRIQDKQIITKIDTKAQQGVKSMLLIRKEQDEVAEWSPILIVGTYSDESTIISYKLDILRRFDGQEPINLSVKNFRNFEKKTTEAVTCLAQLYLNEFFIVGYSSGSIAIFSVENSLPINILPFVYDSPITNLYTVEEGKFFVSASNEKIRFHTIKMINHTRLEQDVTSFYSGTHDINCLMMTTGFNQEESYLKFQHMICGNLRFDDKEDYKEGCLVILRTAQNNIRLTEEAVIPVLTEQTNNTIKDMILIEPRKKQRTVWILIFGGDHKIKLLELKSGYSETLKIWEKQAPDFLLSKGTSVIKGRLLYESIEYTNIKWTDVQSKVQILSAYENNQLGKVNVRFAVVNHLSKSDIEIFELEMMVSYQ
ncbi:hypothetical protein ABPG72_018067 [Tetrahymena utriculariae]